MDTSLILNLKKHIFNLSNNIGERNIDKYENLKATVDYIENNLSLNKKYKIWKQEFKCYEKKFYNIEAEIKGIKYPYKIIIIGSHYDTVKGSPGANDNASGISVMLELAKLLCNYELNYTIRFVAFTNEEPPFIRTKDKGSNYYAKNSKNKDDDIIGMISLETIGYYSDNEKSQKYTFILPESYYPSKGNFIALVGNLKSNTFLDNFKKKFNNFSSITVKEYSGPEWLPGVNSSDHRSFWKYDYPAIMITDTAFLRYPYYHTENDTIDKINFDKLTSLTIALFETIKSLTI